MKKNSRDIVLESRKKAIIDIAYNINKMFVISKIYDEYQYKPDNMIRIFADMLKNNRNYGIYIEEKSLSSYNFTVKEGEYPIIFEYLKPIDKETGKMKYMFFKKYNIDQLVINEEDKQVLIQVYEEENKLDKKYNLRVENIKKFLTEEKQDKLVNMLFVGVINSITGKHIDLKLRFDDEAKKTLIELTKEENFHLELRENFKKAINLVNKYLKNNELEG